MVGSCYHTARKSGNFGQLVGFIGPGGGEEPSWKQRPDPNAVLMLVSMRNIRESSVRLLGERLGCEGVSLYMIGVKVEVDDSSGELVVSGTIEPGCRIATFAREQDRYMYRTSPDEALARPLENVRPRAGGTGPSDGRADSSVRWLRVVGIVG